MQRDLRCNPKTISTLVLWVCAGLFYSQLALAQLDVDRDDPDDERFALGVVVGDPIGLSVKAWLKSERAIAGEIAYSFDDYLLLSADHLWHFKNSIGDDAGFSVALKVFAGAGIAVGFSSSSSTNSNAQETFLFRAPVGVEWFPSQSSFGLSLQVVPALRMVPEVKLKIFGGLAVRYYF